MHIFHQGVTSTKAKKGNNAYFKISEQNPVSVKKITWYILNFQQSACRLPDESQGCAQQFL